MEFSRTQASVVKVLTDREAFGSLVEVVTTAAVGFVLANLALHCPLEVGLATPEPLPKVTPELTVAVTVLRLPIFGVLVDPL